MRNITTFSTPVLRSLFLVQVVVLISFGLSNTLLLPFALKALKATEFEYGLQEGLTSIGFVVTSLLMAKVFDRLQAGAWLAISFLGMGLIGVVYSALQSVPLAIALIAFSGFFNAPSSISRRVIVQRNTPPEMRGRVSSVFFVARDVLFLIGMSAAGLADLMDVRLLYLISAVMLVAAGTFVLSIPDLGQSLAQWKRTFALLRGVEAAPRLGAGRPATMVEVERFISHLPQVMGMSQKERAQLASDTLVAEAVGGKVVTYRGEASDKGRQPGLGPIDGEGEARSDEGVSGRAVQTRRPVWTGDYLADDRFFHAPAPDAFVQEHGIRSALAAPILSDAGVIGTLTVYSGRRDDYDPADADRPTP